MKWVADTPEPGKLHFEIEPEEYTSLPGNQKHTEYKLYVYENGKNTHDYLQEQLQWAKEYARERFGVPLDAWRQIDS